MEITIYWTEFSVKELQNIFEYYRKRVSYQLAKNLVAGIYDATLLLKRQPELGQTEELLQERKE